MTTADGIARRPRRRGRLIGPALLIGLGMLMLFDTIGWIGGETWDSVLRLWPVVLIAAGLDILIGRRSPRSSALVAAALIVAVAGGVWWLGPWRSGGTAIVTDTISQPLDGATRGNVEIAMGVGTLRLGALAGSDQLIAGTIAHRSRDRVTQDYSVRGDTAAVVLRENERKASVFPFYVRNGEDVVWDLALNRDTPLDLTVDTGVGNATIDLAAVRVTDLRVNTGVGTTTLTLPAQGRVQARIRGGVGNTTIAIPAGMAARIEATSGLGSVNVNGTFEHEGKVYTSPDYEHADNRVDLQVSGGIGSINIEYTEGE